MKKLRIQQNLGIKKILKLFRGLLCFKNGLQIWEKYLFIFSTYIRLTFKSKLKYMNIILTHNDEWMRMIIMIPIFFQTCDTQRHLVSSQKKLLQCNLDWPTEY